MSWAKITRVSAVITTLDGDDIVLEPSGNNQILICINNNSAMSVDAQDLLEATAALTTRRSEET